MDQLFSAFSFFADGPGLIVTAATAALIVLIWDWRVALAGLFLMQLGVVTLGVQRYAVDAQWAGMQLIVMLLIVMMLALSVTQVDRPRSLRQSGNWIVRLMALVLIIVAWNALEIDVPVPVFGESVVSLFGWLVLCALLILGLGDSPLFSAVGLLIWLIAAQSMLAVLIPSSNLFALIGGVEVLVALACSYLVLLDRAPGSDRRPVLTDITFPDQAESGLLNGDGYGVSASDQDFAAEMTPQPAFIQQLVSSIEEPSQLPARSGAEQTVTTSLSRGRRQSS